MIPQQTSEPAGLGAGPPPPASLTATLVGSAIIAALGGLLFGFDTVVISGTEEALKGLYYLEGGWWGFTVALGLVGTIVGSIFAGRPADVWGRKPVMLVLAVLYFLAALGSSLAWSWSSLLAFRFVGGLAVGGASVVSPLYIAEISPARFRGRLVATQQFNVVLGILIAFLSNYLISNLHLGASEWRWMLGIQMVPSAAFFALLFATPESPRWLVAHGRSDEARRVLTRLGVEGGGIDREVADIQHSLDLAHQQRGDSLFRAKYRKPIFLAVAVAMFNQLSGINAVMYYAPTIFKMAGAGKGGALLEAVAVGGTNLVFTMMAMTIIDRVGRRKLILIGSIGYLISLTAIAWAFYTYGTEFTPFGSRVVLAGLLLFIAAHAFGQGSVIWVFISEIFPNRVRAEGQALGSTTHWVMAALITWSFPWIAEKSGGHAFAFYAAMMLAQLVWALVVMPETKGIPLEDMQKELGIE